ncbi:hypothetical protein DENIS_3485 [Desulfonema ishimotonii]|uniref:Uncharacterized protein n=1 Tax=Desulfonema ishimotonii TaxID=45657 RepID=A0A401G001_9BACT|nr:hypothetical protein [Desulfonema ishimotonii]GBC62513.1 hypothetical protein DENIS_3485 [Desulfonema ishimotonii]
MTQTQGTRFTKPVRTALAEKLELYWEVYGHGLHYGLHFELRAWTIFFENGRWLSRKLWYRLGGKEMREKARELHNALVEAGANITEGPEEIYKKKYL